MFEIYQTSGPKECLNPNHSFFIRVDNGEDGEIEYRKSLEIYVMKEEQILMVLIVLEGSNGT